jgi:hypothetical protein
MLIQKWMKFVKTIIKILLTAIFLMIAAGLNGGVDMLVHHYHQSFAKYYDLNESFWNPSISWKNKYVNQNLDEGRKQIDLSIISFDVPVLFTDGWHLLKAIMLLFIFLVPAIWIPGKWWKKSLSFIAFVFLWTLSFETVYNKKFEKKTAE